MIPLSCLPLHLFFCCENNHFHCNFPCYSSRIRQQFWNPESSLPHDTTTQLLCVISTFWDPDSKVLSRITHYSNLAFQITYFSPCFLYHLSVALLSDLTLHSSIKSPCHFRMMPVFMCLRMWLGSVSL